MSDDKTLLRETAAQAIRVDYLCVHCGASMKPTSFQCYMDGIQHQCDNQECGHVEVLDREYPYVKYQTA